MMNKRMEELMRMNEWTVIIMDRLYVSILCLQITYSRVMFPDYI